MDLRTYMHTLKADEKKAFAARAGTSLGYLRKVLCKNESVGPGMAIRLARASEGALTVETLRPDVDWSYVKSERPSAEAQ